MCHCHSAAIFSFFQSVFPPPGALHIHLDVSGPAQESSVQSYHLHFDSAKVKTINLKALVEAPAGKEIVDLMESLLCTVMLKNGTHRETEI